MEKFGLLNLLKALDGLKNATPAENAPPSTPDKPPERQNVEPQKAAEQPKVTEPQTAEMPNFMYETLMRHETVSNRLRNKR